MSTGEGDPCVCSASMAVCLCDVANWLFVQVSLRVLHVATLFFAYDLAPEETLAIIEAFLEICQRQAAVVGKKKQ